MKKKTIISCVNSGEISLHCWYGETHFLCSADLIVSPKKCYGKLNYTGMWLTQYCNVNCRSPGIQLVQFHSSSLAYIITNHWQVKSSRLVQNIHLLSSHFHLCHKKVDKESRLATNYWSDKKKANFLREQKGSLFLINCCH